MSDLFWLRVEHILDLALTHGAFWFYLFIFLSNFVENIFPPYPGDTVTFMGGYLAGTSQLKFPFVFLSAGFGCLAGAMLLYFLGKSKGRKAFMKNGRWILDKEHLVKVENWFKKYGEKVLIISRFLTGVRSVVALGAGVGNVTVKKMMVYTSISIILWNGIILFSAFKIEQNWREILRMIQIYNKIMLSIVVLVFIIWLAMTIRAKRSLERKKVNG